MSDHTHDVSCCDVRELFVRIGSLADAIEKQAKALTQTDTDHETRLRSLERRALLWAGGAAAIGVSTSFLPFT